MTATTIITLLIGIFGANITLISALRSQHHDFVKRCFENCDRTVNELWTLVNKGACNASKDAKKAEKEIPRLYNWYWVKALAIPTWVFAIYVIIATAIYLTMPWPQTADGTATDLTSFIVTHVWFVKTLVGGFLVLNLGCFAVAMWSQRRIRNLFEKVEEHIETAQKAVEAEKQKNNNQAQT